MPTNSLVLLLFCCTAAVCVNAGWVKINNHPVCFEGKGGKYGHLQYGGQNHMIAAMKLVRVSGTVRCGGGAQHNSYWGCTRWSGLERYPLNVIITDFSNHIIYPQRQFFKPGNGGLWYYLPATRALDRELVFADYKTPFYLRRHTSLRVWYGEDLRNIWEGDNSGRVCVNVFARLL